MQIHKWLLPTTILVIVSLIGLAIEHRLQQDLAQFNQINDQTIQQQSLTTQKHISSLIKQLQGKAAAIADHQILEERLKNYPTPYDLPQGFFDDLKQFFPEVDDFFFVDASGHQMGSNQTIELGKTCRADVKQSYQAIKSGNHKYTPYLHGGKRLHFDMMIINQAFGRDLLFFASFKAQLVQEIISNSKISPHHTYLLKKNSDYLIEMSDMAIRGEAKFGREKQLSVAEIAAIKTSMEIPGTQWLVVVVEDKTIYNQFKKERIIDALILFVTATLLLLLMYILINQQLKARNRAIKKLKLASQKDSLTGLGNRRLLTEQISLALNNLRDNGIYSAILYIDLDKFKPVNDTHGHNIGDEVLIKVAQRLQTSTRSHDTVVRLGGDEFVILLNQLSDSQQQAYIRLTETSHRIAEAIKKTMLIDEKQINISASIGTTMIHDHELNEKEILNKADALMYETKHSNPDR